MMNAKESNNADEHLLKSEETKNDLDLIRSKRRIILGILYGLISAVGYSFVPLMLYMIPEQGPYGNLASPINATFYVTIQEIMAAFVMFIFYKPKNFISFFKMLRHKETWLVVLYGFLGGPFAMVFFQLSVLLTINNIGQTDGTVPGLLLNLNVILAGVGSAIFFRARQSKYTWTALAISTCLILGMSIHFAINEGLTWKSIGGMCLALITAALYAMEALGMSHLMSSSKINFTNHETVSIKTGSSALLMLLLGTPIAAVASHQSFVEGYKVFANFQYYQYALIFIVGGIIMGSSRMLYYACLVMSGPTYTTSTQLLMFFWTPIWQYIFIATGVPNEILEPTWYYWVYVIPIVFCTFVISSNEFLMYAGKVGWKRAFHELFGKIPKESDTKKL
ncbi:hypothetical protein S100390_v1c09190 [Spiroplasma sp. NBRC 100390]|uniref:hypothetical protein n=1 Tax=unclassified Spiroplasma TaxID=2637901 RepID=UPI00089287A4|nr:MULTISPECIES: hypothetical protein [unclassified Spiroplasma]AOX44255.1 hypothetical protein STU14_v1c09190 [Spiroplasma sp. TU-14]APE13725.1 hypothetical protein S100390_v1c09190 [Spiroplasma sp. NBRC 100390]